MALSSCGDLFEFEGETSEMNKMTLDRHTLHLMAGDTYRFTVSFDPEALRNSAVYWMSNDASVCTFQDGVLVAIGQGETLVTGFSIEHQCADTCRVTVSYAWNDWYSPTIYYPFDMVVNADITVNGQPLTESMQVGAFVEDQLRGIGAQREFFGVKYTEIRVYSNLKPYGPNENTDPLTPEAEPDTSEKVFIRVYDHDNHTMYESTNTIVFDGMTHGYPSDLYRIEL